MGRYAAKRRQESKKKPERKAVEYTTTSGRGKNRVAKPKAKAKELTDNQKLARTPSKPKTIPAKDRPKDMQAGKVYGDAGQPKAPKLPAKPSAPKATTPKKAETGKKLTPMQQWAKANPGLAKKVKKGQSGYKELKIGRSTKPRNWLEKNYKTSKKK